MVNLSTNHLQARIAWSGNKEFTEKKKVKTHVGQTTH